MDDTGAAPPDIAELIEDDELRRTIIKESDFSLSELELLLPRHFDDRPIRCLEVGCGTGLLISRLKTKFPSLMLEGIEPIGSGFSLYEQTLASIIEAGLANISRCRFQEFEAKEPYDLIFSFNVFEHLESWEQYLEFIDVNLKPGGVAIIAFPNYSFPYESHFRLPIIWNKRITGRIFNSYINRFERDNNAAGLWQSLNFVKRPHVIAKLKDLGLGYYVDDEVLSRMIARLSKGDPLGERHRLMGFVSVALARVGLHRLFYLPLLSRFNPYMSLIVTK